ncbi:MAG TPA: lysylphosphatidylglycerol synthase transmembrane domain-containing protein [Drouetiella sp.]
MNGVEEQKAPPSSGSNIWKQLLALAFAGLFLWLSFRGANFGEIWNIAKNAKPLWLFWVFATAVISHVLRAWRWIFLLKPLTDKKISLFNSFCAVMFGYAVNIVIPRGGEVVRLISISKSEKLPWMGVLPTMFIDRLLDIAILGSLLGMTLTQLPKEILSSAPMLIPGGIAITICSIGGLLVLPLASKLISWIANLPAIKSKLSPKLASLLENLATQFGIGTKSLTDPKSYPAIAILTVLIWCMYWVNFYCMVFAFELESKVSAMQCLVVFTIGSFGVLIPTPGNVGSFHYLVSQAMQFTCGIDHSQALAYATVLHFFCSILAICVTAAACWLWQQILARKQSDNTTNASTVSK